MTEGNVSVSGSMQYYAVTALLSEYEKVNVGGITKFAVSWPSVTTAAKPHPPVLVNLTNIILQGKKVMHITVQVQLTIVVAVSASFSLQHCLMLKYVKNREMFTYIFMHANNTPIYKR